MKKTRSADFCADQIDVITNFPVITNAAVCSLYKLCSIYSNQGNHNRNDLSFLYHMYHDCALIAPHKKG